MSEWSTSELKPFGLVVEGRRQDVELRAIPIPLINDWARNHRVVVLRGFAPLSGEALPGFCRCLGELLEWDFGLVNELKVDPQAQNYLYTNRSVPFHWDGAFAGRVPRYIFFHCDQAPDDGSGGETLFCDTMRLLDRTSAEQRALWQLIEITYSTEKIVHYGGAFRSPLICNHPDNGQSVLRFAEPVADLNPVQLEIHGLPQADQAEFLKEMKMRLRDPAVCYSHRWLSGDIVIADNYVLLHGRNQFAATAERHIRRVNIL
jgi:alpha-ketoglutarate-dependent taurine dioxygenase